MYSNRKNKISAILKCAIYENSLSLSRMWHIDYLLVLKTIGRVLANMSIRLIHNLHYYLTFINMSFWTQKCRHFTLTSLTSTSMSPLLISHLFTYMRHIKNVTVTVTHISRWLLFNGSNDCKIVMTNMSPWLIYHLD